MHHSYTPDASPGDENQAELETLRLRLQRYDTEQLLQLYATTQYLGDTALAILRDRTINPEASEAIGSIAMSTKGVSIEFTGQHSDIDRDQTKMIVDAILEDLQTSSSPTMQRATRYIVHRIVTSNEHVLTTRYLCGNTEPNGLRMMDYAGYSTDRSAANAWDRIKPLLFGIEILEVAPGNQSGRYVRGEGLEKYMPGILHETRETNAVGPSSLDRLRYDDRLIPHIQFIDEVLESADISVDSPYYHEALYLLIRLLGAKAEVVTKDMLVGLNEPRGAKFKDVKRRGDGGTNATQKAYESIMRRFETADIIERTATAAEYVLGSAMVDLQSYIQDIAGTIPFSSITIGSITQPDTDDEILEITFTPEEDTEIQESNIPLNDKEEITEQSLMHLPVEVPKSLQLSGDKNSQKIFVGSEEGRLFIRVGHDTKHFPEKFHDYGAQIYVVLALRREMHVSMSQIFQIVAAMELPLNRGEIRVIVDTFLCSSFGLIGLNKSGYKIISPNTETIQLMHEKIDVLRAYGIASDPEHAERILASI